MRSWIATGTRVGSLALAGLVVAVVLGGGASGAVLAAPANDNVADALVLSESTGSVEGSTLEATKEDGEPDHAGDPGGASVWFSWTAGQNGRQSFTTAGTEFATLLAVYRENDGFEEVVSDSSSPSVVEFDAEADTEYLIAVDGADGVSGAYDLAWAPVVGAVDLSVGKTGPSTALVGSTVVYTIPVENQGTLEATSVELTEDLPANAELVSIERDGQPIECPLTEGSAVCDLGTLAAEDTTTLEVMITVSAPGAATNAVQVTSAEVDEDESDNSASAVTTFSESSDEEILIFGPTDSDALRQAVTDAGFVPVVASEETWAGMTTAQFSEYRALLIGDPFCGSLDVVEAAVANRAVWGAAVDGNVIVDGTDPVLHSRDQFTDAAVRFASAATDRTGSYVSLSCYYGNAEPGTPVPLLDAFAPNGFTATDVTGCFDQAHIVADHPAIAGLTDEYLSNWGCSVHSAFDKWPDNFLVLAIALHGTAYTAPDGSVGTPYILARGEGLSVISDITATTAPGASAPGTTRTVSASVIEDNVPQVGKTVTFRVLTGPHAGTQGTGTTDANGTAVFSYTGSSPGTDAIEASYVDSTGKTQTSNRLFVTWEGAPAPPAPPEPPPAGTTTTSGGAGGGAATTTTTAGAPLPPPPPPEEPGTFNAQTKSGTVLVNGQLLTGTTLIRNGDVVDATNGTVEIVTDGGRAEFFGGAFKITQAGADGITRLELVGGDFSICGNQSQARKAGDGKVVRRLWGKGSGKFQTKARYSSATVRGTLWLTEDHCDGSLILTSEGSVTVFDFSLRRTLALPAGQEYFAQEPPPPAPGRFVGNPKGEVIVNGLTLEQNTQIRNGDRIDVRNGSIELTTTSGEASFYSGIFTVRQTGGRGGYTVLTLVGGDFSACGKTKKRKLAGSSQDPPKKNVRSLWGKGTGKFRTKSRFSSATVRGTTWLTVDRCDGSLTFVREGIVDVFDLVLKKTVEVGPGEQYLARAKK
jgi:uncharacterized repeat protein (TIGR01451 family)